MDPLLISIAFASGLAVSFAGLPPLVGFLGAGFILRTLGYQGGELISQVADLGVTFLLFSIGLKLNVKTLFKPEVWGAASLHLFGSVALFSLLLLILKFCGLALIQDLHLVELSTLAFALSFSSTVFAVKVLEQKSEMNALYGRVAIGVLIVQDLFAVLYLTASAGKLPSPWALLLLGLPLLRPLLYRLMDRVGHGELLVLFGLFLALVIGSGLFEAVGLKDDLGALIAGMLLAKHPAAQEMAKSLFNMKELFLVCFFLNVGLQGDPGWSHLWMALALLLILPLKSFIYFLCFSLFRLRNRTALLATLGLTNYSEFGLIVVALAASSGQLPVDWLMVLALALSLSFILSAPLSNRPDLLYQALKPWIKRLQRRNLHQEDRPIRVTDALVLVLGMGRIGTGTYDELVRRYGDVVVGIDHDAEKITQQRQEGRKVLLGDAMDPDFWNKLELSSGARLVMLAMPHHKGNQYAVRQLNRIRYNGTIAAIAQYHDDYQELQDMGVHTVFNMYDEAGLGFARHVCRQLRGTPREPAPDLMLENPETGS